MAGAGIGGGLGRLGTLFAHGWLGGKTDAELLELYADGESAGAAFEAIVIRHGPGVWQACRRVLTDPNDAEDAFQATFLVLARRAGSCSMVRMGTLGPWLNGVAMRVSRKARVAAARRRKHEARVAGRSVAVPATDDRAIAIREEVERLPEPLRGPVVLCYLEGLTYQAAARRLDLSEATIRGRLAKARRLLRSRLGGREDREGKPMRVPPALVVATVRGGIALIPGGAGLSSLPAGVAGLMEGVWTMTLVTRWTMAAGVLLTIGLAAAGGGAMAAKGNDGPAVVTVAAAPRTEPLADPEPARVLTLDDAIGRLIRKMDAEATRLGIPGERADQLAARFRTAPVQHDINISVPIDVSLKRRVRARSSSRPATVAEAQYQNVLRNRIDGLSTAYADVQEMHALIRLQGQWCKSWERLVRLELARRGNAMPPGTVDGNIFRSGLLRSTLPMEPGQGARARARCLALAKLIELGSVAEADRLHVEDLAPVSDVPPAEDLVRLALDARPDLAAIRLSVRNAYSWALDATATLPLSNRNQGNTTRAGVNLRQARTQCDALVEAIRREVGERHRECVSSRAEFREASLDRQRQRRTFLEAEQRYEAGQGGAVEVANARRDLEASERRSLDLLVKHRRASLALNTAVGVKLFP